MANQFTYPLSKDEIAKINIQTKSRHDTLKSVTEIEELYSLDRVRIHQLLQEGRIPGAIKLGNAWYIDLDDAEHFFDEYANWTYERYIARLAKTVHHKIYAYLQQNYNVDTFNYIDPFDDAAYIVPAEKLKDLYSFAESVAKWRYDMGQVYSVNDENCSQNHYVNMIYASLKAAEAIYEKRSREV